MDTRTGEVKPWNEIPAEERHHFVPVKRNMTRQERLAKQIGLYSPCACGSGKKFKFCCHVSNNKHETEAAPGRR